MKQVEQWFAEALAEREARGLLRRRHSPLSGVPFHTNDYLGLSQESGFGVRGSRAVVGDSESVRNLERALARWVDLEDALVLSSGYAANLAALQAAVGPGDRVVSDACNHASIVDGLRLAKADVRVVPHLDLDAVAEALGSRGATQRAWVVTESYFGMDADQPAIGRLADLCEVSRAGLIVDEAHALGVFGPEGGGLCKAAGVRPSVLIGTLGKAVAGVGGFVSGSALFAELVWNRGRSFVFSTAIGDATAMELNVAVARARSADDARARLAENVNFIRSRLAQGGVRCMGHGHIVPIWVGEAVVATKMAEWLISRGLAMYPMRYPTVAQGQARLRLAVTARMTHEELDWAAGLIQEAASCFGL